jgi:hypothetical protein
MHRMSFEVRKQEAKSGRNGSGWPIFLLAATLAVLLWALVQIWTR